MKNQTGTSLLEALVYLMVAGIFCSLTATGLTQAIKSAADRSAQDQLFHLLHFARNQAVLSRENISICAGTETCDDRAAWQSQLMVFTDSNTNGMPDNGDQIVRILHLDQGVLWSWRGFRSNTYLTFEPDGTSRAFNGTAVLCSETSTGLEVVVNLAGRIRSQRTSPTPHCP